MSKISKIKRLPILAVSYPVNLGNPIILLTMSKISKIKRLPVLAVSYPENLENLANPAYSCKSCKSCKSCFAMKNKKERINGSQQ